MAWNSSIKIGNWPLVSIGFVARGIIAIGFTGYGVITIAQFGVGAIAICQFSVGIITISQFSLAIATFGQICAGALVAVGQITAGFFAFGISGHKGFYEFNLRKIESVNSMIYIMKDTITADPQPFFIWISIWAFIFLLCFFLCKKRLTQHRKI